MSDSSLSIVARNSEYPDATSKADEILRWLISENIVEGTMSDSVLSFTQGYRIAAGAKKVIDKEFSSVFDFGTNGLELITERTIFDTGQHGMESLICPKCQLDISDQDWSFFDEWHERKSNNISCPLCMEPSEVHLFDFNPTWGFSNLGFTFWNWPDFEQAFATIRPQTPKGALP
ncbi:MAG: hypothetical protein EOO88_35935, partial [Pedobacter sp.]